MKPNLIKRSKIAVSLFTIFSMALGLMGFAPQASAALTAVGPILDPVNNGYPQWYADENGLALQLCLDQTLSPLGAGLCVLTPAFDPDPTVTPGVPATPIGTVASGNFPDESFYWIADAILDPGVRLLGANTDIKITYRAALEQAFLAGLTPGTQNIFLRVQTDINGLVPGETYTVTHPYGTMTVVADATGGGRTRFEDMGACVQGPTGLICDFANPLATNPVLRSLTTNVGAFLQWDPAVLPAAPAGFIGDPNVAHQVIGGRGGVNSLTVTGLNVGGVGVGSISTNLFAVAGHLADTVAPVITLTGGSPFNVTAGTAYVEPGATAFDAFDAATTTATVATSTVPAGILQLGTGPFSVTYSASDNAGNVATATRIVNVVPDTIAPAITITGSSTVNLKVNTPFVDAGATAIDNVDGAVAVQASSTVNTAVAGTYTVTYTATDSSNNTAIAIRTVTVAQDVTAPAITILGANPVDVTQGAVYTDAGATALDNFDGAVAVTVVSGLPLNTAATGTFSITYSAADTSGNSAIAIRTVNVVNDATPPVITISGANPAAVLVGAVYTDAGATAVDNFDGPIASTSIITTGLPINTAATGTFSVVYSVTDTSGNVATATRVVNVVTDAVAPVITINGANPASLTVGAAYIDAGATALDAVDGAIAVTSTSTVNTAAPGAYTVTYTATDAAGNIATAIRSVNVTVQAPPSSGGGGGGGGFVGGPSVPSAVTAVNVPLSVNQNQNGKLTQRFTDVSQVEIEVDPGTVAEQTTFSVTQGSVSQAMTLPSGAILIGDKVFNIEARTAAGGVVTTFAKPLDISIQVNVPGIDSATINVYFFNAVTDKWERIPGVIYDPVKNAFRFNISHLSSFALLKVAGSPSVISPARPAQPTTPGSVLGVKLFADGTLIRTADRKIFVIVNGGFKKSVASLEELRKLGKREIMNVNDATFAKIPFDTGKVLGAKVFKDGSLIRGRDGKIFVIEKGEKRHIATMAELKKFSRVKIESVDDNTLNSIKTKGAVRLLRARDGKIFAVENNEKRHVRSMDELKSFGKIKVESADDNTLDRIKNKG